jgi:maleate cis-trans isomerase
MPAPNASLDELRGLADHAAQRVALYQRRVYLGRGTPQRLAQLQQEADIAASRLRRARDAAASEKP